MEEFCLESCGAKCAVISDQNLREFFEKNKDYMNIPDLKTLDDSFKAKDVFIYLDCKPSEEAIKCGENCIYMRYPKSELTDSNIAYVVRYLLEKQYGEDNKATCHSACVSKDGYGILLLGGAGSGKTSMAVNMCLQRGYKLVSNDQTVIGLFNTNLYAYGGTKFINFRYSSVTENMPYLEKMIFPEIPDDVWNEKKLVLGKDVGMELEDRPVLINQVDVIQIDNRKKRLGIKSGESWKNNFLLYNILSENIRNTTSTIVDKRGRPIGYVPSYDSEELFSSRCEMMRIINNSSFDVLSGPLDKAIDYIDNKNKILRKEM